MCSFSRQPTGQALSRPRKGFTLVELLVAMAVIGILVALLLPAVQAARESARRIYCKNNLRQTGLAVQLYADTYQMYPPGYVIAPGATSRGGGAWSIHARLLPYLEQTNVQHEIDFSRPYTDPVNTPVAIMRIGTYLCPSEINDVVRVRPNGEPRDYPTTYAFNYGTWKVFDPTTGRGGDGAFYPNSRTRPASVYDGLSNTLCAVEVKAYTPYKRDTADPGPDVPEDPSFLAGLGGDDLMGPHLMDNTGHTEWADGVVHQTGFTTTFPPNTRVSYGEFDIDFTSWREGTTTTRITYAAVTARSYHSGIVHGVLMDGSVRGFSNEIDRSIWRAWGTRAGGEVIP